MEKIKEKELSIEEIFSYGWGIYKTQWINILSAFLIIYIPINIIYALLETLREINKYSNVIIIIMSLIISMFTIFATMSIAFIVENTICGKKVTYYEGLKNAVFRWKSALTTNVLLLLMIAGLLLLLIIPGIIASIYYSFVPQIVMLRGKNGKEALNYSKSLVQNRWWRVFGIGMVVFILIYILQKIIGLSFGLLSQNIIVSIVSNTITDSFTSINAVVITILFLNLDYIENKPMNTEEM
jgi:hypothetical protein